MGLAIDDSDLKAESTLTFVVLTPVSDEVVFSLI